MTSVPLYNPPGHYYSPVTDPEVVGKHLAKVARHQQRRTLPGIRISLADMQAVWNDLLPYLTTNPFSADARPGYRFRFENPSYSYGDASILHAMIRHYRPRRVVEVGSGWSSACTLDTVEQFLGGGCRVTCIDPYPELLLSLIGDRSEGVTILRHPVQDTPLELFEELDEGDILFIDSTHILATGSDVCFELFEILPRLAQGVLVHFHDVFWPFEYPHEWAVIENRSWNELYGLRAFLTDNPRWRVVFFNNYFACHAGRLIESTFPIFLTNSGGAFWLVRVC
jgi:hypothetical protein